MAVYTHIAEDALKSHLSRFDIGALNSFEGIVDGVENSNYKLVTTKGKYILTLFEKRIQPEDLPFYVGFMRHLNAGGIPCPAVIPDKSGSDITSLNGKAALITSFLEGQWPKKTDAAQTAEAGKILARMHLGAKGFSIDRANSMSLPAWQELVGKCDLRAEEVEEGLFAFLKQELAYLESRWPQSLPEGVVHADLFPDNVFFTGNKLTGVIDFYFSCTDAFAYDLMLTANAWCFENGVLNKEKFKSFMTGYQAIRELTAAETASLAFFGRAAALRIISTRLYDWLHPVPGAVIKMKEPQEYVRILKFHQTNPEAVHEAR